jgi:RpiR family carbohydrate utilization transcriptional regulator
MLNMRKPSNFYQFLKDIDLDSLPKKKYRVVKHILDHPDEVILMKTSELAEKLDVDTVTIFNTCKEIGLKGFHDLKNRLKAQGVGSSKPVDKFLNEYQCSSSVDEAIKYGLRRDMEMLTGTIERVSFENIKKASEAIVHSSQTYIIALGYVGNVANYFYSIGRQHIPQLHAITEYNGMLFDYMGHFKKGDVVIAVGFDKCQNQVIKAFKKAKEKGAFTIAITDSEYSPLLKYSKTNLLTSSASNYFLSPFIGALSLCNALLHCIVELTKPQSAHRVIAYNKLLGEENVYYND